MMWVYILYTPYNIRRYHIWSTMYPPLFIKKMKDLFCLSGDGGDQAAAELRDCRIAITPSAVTRPAHHTKFATLHPLSVVLFRTVL